MTKRLLLAEGREVRVCPMCIAVQTQGLERAKRLETGLGNCTACNNKATFHCIGCRTDWCKAHQWEDEPLCVFCKSQGRWYD